MAYEKRIVITGMGVHAPNGHTPQEFYENLIAGKSGIKLMKSVDTSKVRCKVGGDLGDYDIKAKLESFKGQIPEDVLKRAKKIIKTVN